MTQDTYTFINSTSARELAFAPPQNHTQPIAVLKDEAGKLEKLLEKLLAKIDRLKDRGNKGDAEAAKEAERLSRRQLPGLRADLDLILKKLMDRGVVPPGTTGGPTGTPTP